MGRLFLRRRKRIDIVGDDNAGRQCLFIGRSGKENAVQVDLGDPLVGRKAPNVRTVVTQRPVNKPECNTRDLSEY